MGSIKCIGSIERIGRTERTRGENAKRPDGTPPRGRAAAGASGTATGSTAPFFCAACALGTYSSEESEDTHSLSWEEAAEDRLLPVQQDDFAPIILAWFQVGWYPISAHGLQRERPDDCEPPYLFRPHHLGAVGVPCAGTCLQLAA